MLAIHNVDKKGQKRVFFSYLILLCIQGMEVPPLLHTIRYCRYVEDLRYINMRNCRQVSYWVEIIE